MRKLLLLLLATVLSGVGYAQQKTIAEFRFVAGKDMFFTPWKGNGENLKKLSEFIAAHREAITSGTAPIYVDGYCMNLSRGKVMANRVKSDLISNDGILEKHFITKNIAQSYNGINNIVVVRIEVDEPEGEIFGEEKLDLVEVKEQPKSKEEPKQEPVTAEQPKAEPMAKIKVSEPRDVFSIRTNLLYWAGGMMNAGVEYKPSRTIGIVVNGGYSPFASENWKYQMAGWYVAPEVRVYLGEAKRWYVGGQFLMGDYNYKLSETGRIGSVIGGGVTGGYKLYLTKCLDMDFTLGLGYGQLKYDTYRQADNKTNVYTERGIVKNNFIPTQLGVSLIFKIK